MSNRQVIGKRERMARVSASLGFSFILERMPKRKVLIVLNYHRIGSGAETPYDPGVFSATAEEFDEQIAYLKRYFYMATLEESMSLAHGVSLRRASVLITFDDGYIDNYSIAFPILKSHGVQGVFFLPTAFIGTNHVPWWDQIAFIVKRSRNNAITLQYPCTMAVDLERDGIESSIRRILNLYKQPATTDKDCFVRELQMACGHSELPKNLRRCFMSWQEAREMARAGMVFGSHTHSHEIVSKLSADEELNEIRRSRQLLERELACRVESLAYPVGNPTTFSSRTVNALKANGYRAAFSKYGGTNRPGRTSPFDIRRCAVDGVSHPRFRLQTAIGGITGTRWF